VARQAAAPSLSYLDTLPVAKTQSRIANRTCPLLVNLSTTLPPFSLSPPGPFEQFHSWMYCTRFDRGSILPRLYSKVLSGFLRTLKLLLLRFLCAQCVESIKMRTEAKTSSKPQATNPKSSGGRRRKSCVGSCCRRQFRTESTLRQSPRLPRFSPSHRAW
jgi:hypothetical protein